MNVQEISLVRQILSLNQKRNARFGGHLFADSGWEIMLAMHNADQPVSRDLILEWVNMPDRMLRRWLDLLKSQGWITRQTSQSGPEYYELSLAGRASLDAILSDAVLEQAA